MELPGRLVLLGHPVAHSLSPVVQNAALSALGIPLRYETYDVPPAALGAALDELGTAQAAGNVTIPHKAAVFTRCGVLTKVAERVGAVNAFRTRRDGALEGTNTDVAGFEALVRSVTDAVPDRVAVIGAGAAAAAVLAALEGWRTTRAVLYNRSPARAHHLARRFPALVSLAANLDQAVRGADLVVNTTPLGQLDDLRPVNIELLHPESVVLDLVYRSGETPWVRDAKAAGHPAADGSAMLLEQGARSFEFWFGMEAPRGVMRSALLQGCAT